MVGFLYIFLCINKAELILLPRHVAVFKTVFRNLFENKYKLLLCAHGQLAKPQNAATGTFPILFIHFTWTRHTQLTV